MLSNSRLCAASADARVAQGMVFAFAVLLGGCSADVTRFDFPLFGLTEKGGETIQVQQGDTLYGIAKRYGVSISALIEVNGLAHGSTIKPGQQLVLPTGVIAAKPVPEQPAGRAPLARTPSAPPPATAPIATAGWEGRHTLKAGESLYSIARQHGVALAELQRVNGITEPTRVRAGTVLFVPGNAEPAPAVAERIPAAT